MFNSSGTGSKRGKRKGSTPTGDKADSDLQKSDVPPTPDVEAKPEGDEDGEDGEEKDDDKAPKTVSSSLLAIALVQGGRLDA